LPPPRVSKYVQLTRDGEQKVLNATGGLRLYLSSFDDGVEKIMAMPVSGGDPFPIPVPSQTMTPHGVSPDGAELLATDVPGNLWILPTLGGSPRRLESAASDHPFGTAAAWSADGKMLVYTNTSDAFLAKSDGAEARKLIFIPGRLYNPQISPDGKRIRVREEDQKTGNRALWEVSTQGTNLHRRLEGLHAPTDEDYGKWTPDGRYFVFQSGGQIWRSPTRQAS
jgi:WD40-like Beta Propeller Repeat